MLMSGLSQVLMQSPLLNLYQHGTDRDQGELKTERGPRQKVWREDTQHTQVHTDTLTCRYIQHPKTQTSDRQADTCTHPHTTGYVPTHRHMHTYIHT